MNDEKIARLVVDFLLADAGGMVKSSDDKKEDTSDKEEKTEKKPKETKGQIEKIFDVFEKKLFAVLAPVAIAASIFASATSGMGVFLGAVKILGSVLGMTLAPGIIALSALILTISDYIQEALLPNLEDWYAAVLTFAIGAVDWLEKSLVVAANAIIDFAAEVLKGTAKMMMMGSFLLFLMGNLKESLGLKQSAAGDKLAAGALGKQAVEANKTANDLMPIIKGSLFSKLNIQTDSQGNPILPDIGAFTDRYKSNLRKSTDEMAFQLMPKSQQTSLAGANMAAQMATIQMSPFEREQLKLSALTVDAMNRAVAKLTLPTTN